MSEETFESIEKELKKRPTSIIEPSLRPIGKNELNQFIQHNEILLYKKRFN